MVQGPHALPRSAGRAYVQSGQISHRPGAGNRRTGARLIPVRNPSREFTSSCDCLGDAAEPTAVCRHHWEIAASNSEGCAGGDRVRPPEAHLPGVSPLSARIEHPRSVGASLLNPRARLAIRSTHPATEASAANVVRSAEGCVVPGPACAEQRRVGQTRGSDPTSQSASSAARMADRCFPVAPDAHARAVNALRTARVESAAARPNVPPVARPAPGPRAAARATDTAERPGKKVAA